jgi:hypothetical protein
VFDSGNGNSFICLMLSVIDNAFVDNSVQI